MRLIHGRNQNSNPCWMSNVMKEQEHELACIHLGFRTSRRCFMFSVQPVIALALTCTGHRPTESPQNQIRRVRSYMTVRWQARPNTTFLQVTTTNCMADVCQYVSNSQSTATERHAGRIRAGCLRYSRTLREEAQVAVIFLHTMHSTMTRR